MRGFLSSLMVLFVACLSATIIPSNAVGQPEETQVSKSLDQRKKTESDQLKHPSEERFLQESSIGTTRSFQEVELTLTDSRQFDAISQDGSVLGLIDSREVQVVLVLTERMTWLQDIGVTIRATEPPKERRPPASFESPAAAPGSDKIYGCYTNDGNELEWCSNSHCNTSDPYFYNGVDLDCGVLVGTYAWWRHHLPYSCAQSYNDLDVGFYGKGTSWPDNGASIFVYNWQTETWVEVWVNVGTDEGWYMQDIDHTIGTYISPTYHNVLVRLYASSTDCAYIRDVEVCYDYNEKPPVCYVFPTSMTCPNTCLGQTNCDKSFIIRNDGCGTLSGNVSESSDHFSVSPNSYYLAPDEYQLFTVCYQPQTCGEHSTTISTGAGCNNVSVSGSCDCPVDCYVSRTHITFQDTDLGQSSSETFFIRNDGCGNLSGTVDESSNHFWLSASGGLGYNLGPGQSKLYTVYFEPQSCGNKSTTVNTGSDCSNVLVEGECNGPTICYVSRTDISFPDTDVGQSSSETFYIRNDGCGILSGTVSETCPDFWVSASGGLGYNLGPGQSKTFTVHFEPQSCGNKTCDINTGPHCDNVFAHGNSPCTGTIEGHVKAPNGVTGVPDVQVCADCVGCASTDINGHYEIHQVPLNQLCTVIPSKPDHVFEPDSRPCTITNPNQTCVADFVDVTMCQICGTVRYSTCNNAPAEGIDIYVDGQYQTTTDANGHYCVSAYSLEQHTIDPRRAGHLFDPPDRIVDCSQGDVSDADFMDTTSHSVSGYCKTSCDQGLEGVVVSAASNFCNVSAPETGANGYYHLDLPPGTYTLCANHPDFEFDCSDPIDLVNDTTHDFVHKTYLKLVVSEDPLCNAIARGESYLYTVSVFDELDCPVTDATITITDEVSDTLCGTPTPIVIPLTGVSQFQYEVVGGCPQIDKSLNMSVYKEGYNNAENLGFSTNLTVTGRRYIGETFVTKLANQTPFMILYDPPGDMSYAFLESTDKYYAEFGMFVKQENNFSYEVRAGVDLPFVSAGVEAGGSLTVSGGVQRRIEYEISNTSRYETEHSQWDGEPCLKGPGHGTQFLAAGINIRYGKALEISVDTSTCVASDSIVFGFDVDTNQTGITSYYNSTCQIIRDVLPDPLLPTEDSINWEKLIALDLSLDNAITSDEIDSGRVVIDSCKSYTWPGGGEQGFQTSTTINAMMAFESEIEIEEHLAVEFGFDYYVSVGGKATISTKITVGSEAVFGFEKTNTIGYWLGDNESVDYFETQICYDAASGVPVFINQPGTRTMCPWEPFTSKNEDVDLINVTGVWDTIVICGDSVCIEFRFVFLGMLPGGSYFKLWAPPDLNPCGAQVLFNGVPGPLENIHVDKDNAFVVNVCITPTCTCETDTVTIRAQSMCDPQIFSDETIIVHTTYTGIGIGPPFDGDTVSGLVDIVAKTNQHPIDGVKFFVKEQYEPGYYELCFDTIPDGGQAPFEYTCTWDSESWSSNKYYYIKACIVEVGITGECDSVLVYLDNECPYVLSTVPTDNGEYFGTISAEFSEEIDESTLDCMSFLLYDNTVVASVPCQLVPYSDRIAEFIPAIDIEQGHEYTATLTTDIRDLSGNTLCSEYSWTFTTGECVSWLATIEAQGEIVGDAPNLFDVKIGEDSTESTVPSPGPPPEYTTFIKLYRADWSGPYYLDIRQCGQVRQCWIVAVNPSGNAMPPQDRTTLLSWNPAHFKADGVYRLREGYDCTGPVVVSDMRLTNDYAVTGSNQDYYYTIEWSGEACWDYDLGGWGLVSLPVTPDNFLTNYLFPDAEVAFEFDQTYAIADSMQPCNGYWLKMPLTDTVTVCGTPVNACIEFLSAGWHLRGGPFCTTTAITDPPGCVEAIFGFDSSYYLTTEFAPGKAYWVNLSDDCELRLECGGPTLFAKEQTSGMSTNSRCEITIHAQGESLGGVSEANVIVGLDNTPDSVPAPPDPPEYSVSLKVYQPDWDGPFYQDIRMDTSGEQVWILAINPHGNIMPPDPRSATVSWDPVELCTGYDFELREGSEVTGALLISDMRNTTELVVTGTEQVYYYTIIANSVNALVEDVPNLPLMFRLYQSYPNPFNPNTTIEYDLPKRAFVNLTIYNLLGQRVRTLVDLDKSAGRHTINWDGKDDRGQEVASGVYFYRIKAGEFTSTKKLLLLR